MEDNTKNEKSLLKRRKRKSGLGSKKPKKRKVEVVEPHVSFDTPSTSIQQQTFDVEPSAKKPEDVVELNVGGTLLSTLSTTLTKEPKSKLADMFSGPQKISKDKNGGRYFIDCDGEVFKYILDFLRFDTLPRQEKALEVYDLAVHFKIQSLVDTLGNCHSVEYRRNIAKIREDLKPDLDTSYENLKKKVVEDIRRNPYCSPREDIYLYETSSVGVCDYCPLPYAHIFLRPTFNLNDDRRALLLYDLCELGYGKFTVINKILERCNSCKAVYKCKQLILRKH